jgi:hypothetical protein
MTLEETLDRWATDHLEAAVALRKIIREALKTTGYRHIGRAVAELEVPEDWRPEVSGSGKQTD